MEYRDYYATLGVPRTATAAEIKKQFRKLARQHHPDVNKGDTTAEKRFKELNEAYAVLGDAEKRKAYDALGANWEAYQRAGAGSGRAGDPFAGFPGGFAGGAAGGAPGGVRFEYRGDPEDLAGFSDFFRTFFAGGSSRGGATSSDRAGVGTRPRSRVGSLEDLFAGLGGDELADNGARRGATGAGGRAGRQPAADADAEITLEEVASGTRRRVDVGGRRHEVTIPQGVLDGQRIRFAGMAGADGDVYLRIKVRPHPIFTRSGPDLQRELPITLAEALLGAEVPVETLGGRVLLRIPPGTQNGRNFRLAGKGLPRFKAEGRGDLYVRTRVVLPTDLDERGRELAAQLAQHANQPDPRTAS